MPTICADSPRRAPGQGLHCHGGLPTDQMMQNGDSQPGRPGPFGAGLSERTRAIVVPYLWGTPCGMEPIVEVADARGVPVIEDCAQAFLARRSGRLVGTFGTIGCFSLQQGKHLTTGEGGLVTTDDPELARRMFLFINKAWGYGDPTPDHYFLALNYRLSELQGAVAVAQLAKLEGVVKRRVAAAARLTQQLHGLPGIETPHVAAGCVHTYWK